jgi:hypothetical protein
VSDIFQEVEEEVRRERFEKLWKEYGDYIIAGAAFIVIAAAGLQLWRVYEQRQTLKASQEYIAAQQLLASGQNAAAAQAYGHLASDAPGGYAAVSRLQEAGALAAAGRPDDSLKLYKEIAAGKDPILAAVARIREAWMIVDTSPKADVQQILAPLTDPSSAWNGMAREVLAYADYRAGNTKSALAEYKSLLKDKNEGLTLRERANAMVVFLTSGAGANYGTVPPPPKAVALPAAPAIDPSAAQTATPQGAPKK